MFLLFFALFFIYPISASLIVNYESPAAIRVTESIYPYNEGQFIAKLFFALPRVLPSEADAVLGSSSALLRHELFELLLTYPGSIANDTRRYSVSISAAYRVGSNMDGQVVLTSFQTFSPGITASAGSWHSISVSFRSSVPLQSSNGLRNSRFSIWLDNTEYTNDASFVSPLASPSPLYIGYAPDDPLQSSTRMLVNDAFIGVISDFGLIGPIPLLVPKPCLLAQRNRRPCVPEPPLPTPGSVDSPCTGCLVGVVDFVPFDLNLESLSVENVPVGLDRAGSPLLEAVMQFNSSFVPKGQGVCPELYQLEESYCRPIATSLAARVTPSTASESRHSSSSSISLQFTSTEVILSSSDSSPAAASLPFFARTDRVVLVVSIVILILTIALFIFVVVFCRRRRNRLMRREGKIRLNSVSSSSASSELHRHYHHQQHQSRDANYGVVGYANGSASSGSNGSGSGSGEAGDVSRPHGGRRRKGSQRGAAIRQEYGNIGLPNDAYTKAPALYDKVHYDRVLDNDKAGYDHVVGFPTQSTVQLPNSENVSNYDKVVDYDRVDGFPTGLTEELSIQSEK